MSVKVGGPVAATSKWKPVNPVTTPGLDRARDIVGRIREKYRAKTAGCYDAHLCCDEILGALEECRHE